MPRNRPCRPRTGSSIPKTYRNWLTSRTPNSAHISSFLAQLFKVVLLLVAVMQLPVSISQLIVEMSYTNLEIGWELRNDR